MQAIDFSVVIPLYNKRDYVLATLHSVLAQTRPPREILVIDNNSTDDGPDLVRSLANPLIRLLSEPEPGPGPARNHGIAEARSDWIAFLDADDLWAPNHLELLEESIRQHPAAVLHTTAFRAVPADTPAPPPPGAGSSREFDFYEQDSLVWTSTTSIRRAQLLESDGFARFPAGEDTDLWIRLALAGHFAASTALTAYYRRGNDGIMDRQQAARQHEAPPPHPVFATIATLLADPAHRDRHAALAAYGDRLRRTFARQLLYNAHPAAARTLLQGCTSRGRSWWLWWAASLIPPALLRLIVRLWSARRRQRARAWT